MAAASHSGPKVELALDSRCILGESPVSSPDGWLHFVDINGKAVLGLDTSAAGGSSSGAAGLGTKTLLPEAVGCIVPRGRGGLLAAMESSIVHLSPAATSAPLTEEFSVGEVVAVLSEEHRGPKIRFNDGKCDPSGNFWVGSMHGSWRDPSAPSGHLFMLPSRPAAGAGGAAAGSSLGQLGPLEVKVSPTRLANGMAWSHDASHMFFVDSALKTVDVFDFDASSSAISNRRTVVTIDAAEAGVPDGMCIDATGCLWVVVGESLFVRQFDSETGREIQRVPLPVKRPTSCAFGGKDLSHLYVTTREEPGSSPSPHAGSLFRCLIPGVKGPAHAVAFAA